MNQVEEYLLKLDEDRRDIMLYLHHLFTERLGMRTRLRWGLPFYDFRRWVCYTNPKKSGGVELVFLFGQKLADPSGILDSTGRKQVAGVTFYQLSEIPEEEIIALVEQERYS